MPPEVLEEGEGVREGRDGREEEGGGQLVGATQEGGLPGQTEVHGQRRWQRVEKRVQRWRALTVKWDRSENTTDTMSVEVDSEVG